jgi:serine/threonine-protein kinase
VQQPQESGEVAPSPQPEIGAQTAQAEPATQPAEPASTAQPDAEPPVSTAETQAGGNEAAPQAEGPAQPGEGEIKVATAPETSVPKITAAADQLAWLNAYQLGECEYVHATQVADSGFGIEAYGSDPKAFDALASDFKTASGVDPQVGVRLLDPSQCAVADFLTAAKTLPRDGGAVPSLELSAPSYNLQSGGTLSGTVRNWAGWTTDLLLVDYGGGIQNVSALLRPDGTFALPNLVIDSPAPVPLVLLTVSGRDGPVAAAQLSGTYVAGAVLPTLLKEMKSRPGEVAVSAAYFRVSPAKTANP